MLKAILIAILIYLIVGNIVAMGYTMGDLKKYTIRGYLLTVFLWFFGVYDELKRRR